MGTPLVLGARSACCGAFQLEFEAAVRSLEQQAHVFPEVPPGIRRKLFSRYPYALLYRVTGREVLVAAVLHLRRQPGYWTTKGR